MVTKKFFNYFFIYYEFSKIISLSLHRHLLKPRKGFGG